MIDEVVENKMVFSWACVSFEHSPIYFLLYSFRCMLVLEWFSFCCAGVWSRHSEHPGTSPSWVIVQGYMCFRLPGYTRPAQVTPRTTTDKTIFLWFSWYFECFRSVFSGVFWCVYVSNTYSYSYWSDSFNVSSTVKELWNFQLLFSPVSLLIEPITCNLCLLFCPDWVFYPELSCFVFGSVVVGWLV